MQSDLQFWQALVYVCLIHVVNHWFKLYDRSICFSYEVLVGSQIFCGLKSTQKYKVAKNGSPLVFTFVRRHVYSLHSPTDIHMQPLSLYSFSPTVSVSREVWGFNEATVQLRDTTTSHLQRWRQTAHHSCRMYLESLGLSGFARTIPLCVFYKSAGLLWKWYLLYLENLLRESGLWWNNSFPPPFTESYLIQSGMAAQKAAHGFHSLT